MSSHADTLEFGIKIRRERKKIDEAVREILEMEEKDN